MAAEVLRFDDVDVWVYDDRMGRTELVQGVQWRVHEGECWALLGPNGAGKSTLLSLAGALRHPSRGTVRVLGERLGRVDVRELRAIVGNVNPTQRIPERLGLRDYVLTGATGTIQPLPRRIGRDDEKRADELLDMLGLSDLARREIAVCSQGERARARIARALVPRPRLLLLDEATSGLDLPSREEVLASLETLVAEEPRLALVVVTHHLEELPTTTTHAIVLRSGRVVSSGPASACLTSETLSTAFDLPLEVQHVDGRWTARRRARRPVRD